MKHQVLTTFVAFVAASLPSLAHADDAAPRTRAFVHLRGGDVAALQKRAADSDGWVTVCDAPCDRSVPLGIEYRIGGDGVRASEPFYLDRDKARIELDTNLATTSGHRAGIGIAALGGAATVLGGVLIATAYISANNPYTAVADALVTVAGGKPEPPTVDVAWIVAGGVTIAAGVATAIGGIVLAVTNQKTTVTQSAALADRDVARRTPTWREAPTTPTPTGSPMVVPLWSGTF